MADFCHDWDPGGLGCPHRENDDGEFVTNCPDGCLGDFHWALKEYKDMKPGYEVQLGICEGHGTIAYLENDGGTLKLVEYPIGGVVKE